MKERFSSRKMILFVAIICLYSRITSADFVPFVIPGEPEPASLIAETLTPIATDSPRIVATGEQFTRDGQPIRFLGVNTSFAGNFPDHAGAERMAKRLAAVGVNCVRLHHMDTSWWPNGLWDPSNGQTIYAPALERLDYYIDQLAQYGIYVDLNLHVGRSHSDYIGLPDPGTGYNKIVGIFTPLLITEQEGFASTMLNHVNAYRGVRYADDPAVALVEITNEDSFFMWDGPESLQNLPTYYADIIQSLYNDWLLAHYGTTSALETAWADGIEPLGDNMLTNGDFQNVNGSGFPYNWILEQHEESTGYGIVTTYNSIDCLSLVVTNDDGTGWHLQFNQPGLEVENDRYYTLFFDAAAAASRSSHVSVMRAHDPWTNVGLATTINLTTSWQSFRLGFTSNDDDTNVRVNFTFGGESETLYLANVELRPGGQAGLLPGEDLSLQNVAFLVDYAGKPREIDRLSFLAETEKDYFDNMYDYIKTTIGCDALVTGTIVFGPLGLYAQSDMDFIDSHSYWRHPWFPGTPWDMSNWFVEQDAMTDLPDQATLFRIAVERLAGKPFTVTEYNHPAPNDYQSECMPMLASFAAAHDWNGIWLYSYAHDYHIWDDEYFNSFFDSANNPGKFGFMRAAAAILRDGTIGPLGSEQVINLAPTGDALRDAVELRYYHGDNVWNAVTAEHSINWQNLLTEKIKMSFSPVSPSSDSDEVTLTWTTLSNQGFYSAIGKGAFAFAGWAGQYAGGTSNIMTALDPAYISTIVTALDGLDFTQTQEILVATCGRCENTNMIFSPDRRTVGTNWGEAPVQIEAVTGTLKLPPGIWTCRALAPDGTESSTVPVSYACNQISISLDSTHSTMWYLLERQPEIQPANLTLYKTIDVSSEIPGFEGDNAVDGSSSTRWASESSDPQYITIDFGAQTEFNTVHLYWDTAYASEYLIQASDNNLDWADLINEQNGDGGLDDYTVYANAQYLRIYGSHSAGSNGYSLAEIEVYQCQLMDLACFSILASHWLESDCSLYYDCSGMDLLDDNSMNLFDLQLLSQSWLQNICSTTP
ncbi:MAG: discoidin domain-containing protein [Sedimentisphaerales bacterium]|nr:discoidin domain-containing protein [Sedimentisphaerales bacterium]